ncbi:hypothetical protein [Riemerella anatipestifer]|uniref:Uncharacterized protein n=1 Tax=Riemerella anatipestifer TaxID=34085 RepID=A0A1S7DQ03_RIEAN|nr:hypothetical protein [Riemerella anatipestifer]AQY21190.1 hypothetical protein AB406_0227 [Riemerella anatipestifer]MDY3344239.1 hypothetical protein [Riemerella anatipestifer]MDY3357319.1 hypothetical protein [Riemerella anatipestifer]MDY3537686.1 hypothetical protein [Riemerella anatipestifer]
MIQEKHLILGAKELGLITSILATTIPIMVKLELNKESVYMTIFVFILSMVFLYCNFQLFLLEIFRFVKRLKEKSKKSIKELGDKIAESKKYFLNKENISYQLVKAEIPIVNIYNMSCPSLQQPKKELIEKQTEPTEKQEKAIEYTQKIFENHIENPQDLENFYKEIIAYSNGKTDFSNSKSIIVKDLTNYDLYHFGWNIWNHFKVGKQEIIANFLQNIFTEKLGNQTESTIIKHLRDDEKKGKIILLKDITKFSQNKLLCFLM